MLCPDVSGTMSHVVHLLLSLLPLACSRTVRMVDLSHVADPVTAIQWPTAKALSKEIVFRGGKEHFYYENNNFEQSEHCATHMDAPSHFVQGAKRIHEIEIEELTGEAVLIDISHKARLDVDAELDLSDILSFEWQHGRIKNDSIVLLFSDHGKHYLNKTRYLGYPDQALEGSRDVENLHFAGFHPEAARMLAEERHIKGVGVDTPSLDFGQSTKFESHVHFGRRNIWGLENLANLDQLPPKGFVLMANVYKLKDGSGAPARPVAFINSFPNSQ